MRLEQPEGGVAVITDNLPLQGENLARCLDDGLPPADWGAKLNERARFSGWMCRAGNGS